jgi:hypothetical protein
MAEKQSALPETSVWPFVVAVLLLIIAPLERWPYVFYTLLRFVVFGVSIYGAIKAHDCRRNRWVWTLSVIAVLFNPFILIHLRRDTWAYIDLLAASVLGSVAFILRRPQTISKAPGMPNTVAQKVPDRAKTDEEKERRKIGAHEFERLKSYCQDIGLKLDKVAGGYAVLAPSSMDPYRDQWIKKELQSSFHVEVTSQSNNPTGWRRLGKVESPEELEDIG